MASIRKRGSSYLIVVSMGYDYNGKRINPRQKTVHPPEELTPRQVEKWLNDQAVLFERDCRHTPQPGLQPLTNLRDRRLSLQFAPGRRHQRHTSGQRTQRTALCQHRGPFEQRHLGRS